MTNLRDLFERVYVINLASRPDRLKAFYQDIGACGWPFAWPQAYPAVNGDVVGIPYNRPDEGHRTYAQDKWLVTVPPEYGDPRCPNALQGGRALGCRISHCRILEDCIMEGVKSVLILEDDAIVRHGFAEGAERFLQAIPDDWQGLMLGGQHHAAPSVCIGGIWQRRPFQYVREDDTELSPRVVKVNYAQRTHCYGARPAYMKALHARWINCLAHIDWLMQDWQDKQTVYGPLRWLVGQRQGFSDITCRDKPEDFWNPADGNGIGGGGINGRAVPLFILKCPREAVEALASLGAHRGNWIDKTTGIDMGLTRIFQGKRIYDDGPCVDWAAELRVWFATLAAEAVQRNAAVVAWHPELTREVLGEALGRKVEEVGELEAESAEEAVRKWQRREVVEVVEDRPQGPQGTQGNVEGESE